MSQSPHPPCNNTLFRVSIGPKDAPREVRGERACEARIARILRENGDPLWRDSDVFGVRDGRLPRRICAARCVTGPIAISGRPTQIGEGGSKL